ncbi:histidine phosphatase family protein [Marinobacterium sp. D7]|uniref:SixA phosphatase family protein n=1 Tax=Marinobacterium ramblicola TaxID=2849041 RepID=UPI001C2D6017|nr:histidine phosphatase family protein [Marinobacterium ramblicola]MBV1786797.1 histidine phosphatase family protein [Marinobacterium ramblicola]
MKQLTLIRHAKSSWDNPGLDDFDRPLNARGMRDLPLMATRVKAMGLIPQRLLYSSATRTAVTARTLAQTLELDDRAFIAIPEMYEACWETLLNLLQGQPDHLDSIMLVGHNPGMADLGSYLSGHAQYHFPTSAVQHLMLNVLSWSELAESCGSTQIFDYPKLHT